MTKYNGHRSWNSWNVRLWLLNDEGTYSWMKSYVDTYGKAKAARMLARDLAGQSTPDGAKYNLTCIREALVDM